MARKPRTAKGRVMKPNFFVFCEGETEVAYVDILRLGVMEWLEGADESSLSADTFKQYISAAIEQHHLR